MRRAVTAGALGAVLVAWAGTLLFLAAGDDDDAATPPFACTWEPTGQRWPAGQVLGTVGDRWIGCSSKPWVSAAAGGDGRSLVVRFRPLCRGGTVVARESAKAIEVAVLTTEPLGLHGCLPIGFDLSRVTVELAGPVDGRRLVHAPVTGRLAVPSGVPH
jgi:hypothetical protein